MKDKELILTALKTSEGMGVINLSTTRCWEQALAVVVCSNMRCKVIVSTIEKRSYIEVRGFDSELKAAIDTFTKLLNFCRGAIVGEKKKARLFDGKVGGVENAYASSFICAVSDVMSNSARAYSLPHSIRKFDRNAANIQAAMLAGYSDGYSYTSQLTA